MKNNKLKIGLLGYLTSLLANLSIGQNWRKRKTLKNQIEITIYDLSSKFQWLSFFTGCISLFANG